MRKLFSLSVVLMVVAGMLLSACQTPAAPTAAPAPAQPAQPAAPTQAPAQPAPVAFKVGLVTDVGKVDDKSFNQSAWEGVQQAVKELGVEAKYIETTDPKDYGKNIAQFADEKYDVIVTVGFGLGEATTAAAKQYPNVKFIGVDQDQSAGTTPGLAGLVFPEDQSGFLAGALAASMSKSGQIGAVLGTDVVPPVWRFGEGYRAGALYINPDIKVTTVYHNDVGFDKTFSDPEWGKTTALSMIDKGADVIFGAGGKTGNGALLACAEKGCYAIGVDTDQYLTVPEAQKVMLTSAMKLIVPGVADLIKAAKDGKWTDGNVYGAAGLAPYHDLDSQVPADVKAKIDDLTKKVQGGEIKTGVAATKPAEEPKKALKVGLVTDVGKVDDKSFNQSAWEGVQQAVTDLGVEAKYIETTDPKDYGKNIAQFADEGYDVIVTVGFGLGEATTAAAKQYPNVKFIGVDQDQSAGTTLGLAGLVFPEDQSGFLAGALAGLMSKSGQIGAVLGTDVVPPVWRFGEGYRAGALYVNPDIKVTTVYHNDVGFDKTFSDPEWGKTTALSMIDKGADVIFGAGGKTGNGALLACAEKGCYAIGVDTDQYLTVPEAQKVMLTSAMKLIVPGVANLIKAVQDGTWADGNVYGQAGLAPYHDLDSQVSAEVKAKIDEINKGLLDGSIKTGVAPTKPQ